VLIASAILGFYGFWLAILVVLVHLASLKSFGFPYMFPYTSGEINGFGDFKDTLFRLPMSIMKKRPIFANPGNRVRQT
jgi:spore germination protein